MREKFNKFLKSPKEYPILAGFSVGYYALMFYFSNNFNLINSWSQFFYFSIYFILLPIVLFWGVFKLIQKTKYSTYTSLLLTVLMFVFLVNFLIGFSEIFSSYKKMALFVFIILFLIVFKIRIYKYAIVFVFFMSIIPSFLYGKILCFNLTHSNEWQDQNDHILKAVFIKKPNVYYIQPDGYANEVNLNGSLYHYDNSSFDTFLKNKNFTSYTNYRSNYSSTLSSNSSCFSMKHHYLSDFSGFEFARDIIVGNNPVLKIFKNNDYKTLFITERPYLIMNRPTVLFDYYNFQNIQFSRYKDGWDDFHEITEELKNQILLNKKSNNFFFIEKFEPEHISNTPYDGVSVKKERDKYIAKLQKVNIWLKNIITFITVHDPNGIIIVGADHAGFVGFEYTFQAIDKKNIDKKLLNSMYGAKLAIKWNTSNHQVYDTNLKTSVNLFRVLFAYLSADKSLLKGMQEDKSYKYYMSNGIKTIYEALDEKGNVPVK